MISLCCEAPTQSLLGSTMVPPGLIISQNVNLMELIRSFYGDKSLMYLGVLSPYQSRAWRSPKITSRHHVVESRRRISRVTRDPRMKNTLPRFVTKCIQAAVTKGDLKGVRRMEMYRRRRGITPSSVKGFGGMDAAARSGSLPLLDHFQQGGYPTGTSTMVSAMRSENRVNVAKWLISNDCKVDEDAHVEAANIGNVTLLKMFSRRKNFGGFSQKALRHAGSIATVEFLLDTGRHSPHLTPRVIAMAALKGELDLVKHLKDRGCDRDERVCWVAAYGGHIGVLKWARSQRPPCHWDCMTVKVAKNRKHPGIVKYAVDNGCPGSRFFVVLGL